MIISVTWPELQKYLVTGDISPLNTSPIVGLIAAFWFGWVFLFICDYFLFPFHVCLLNRTLKNLFQFMFITLLFIYPASFMFCLRSNTENNIVSLVNLSLHFQGWCLTSKCLLCTPINELCYQNITTDLHPRKMLTVRDRRKFCLDICC